MNPTHAIIRKTPFLRHGIPSNEVTYLAAGSAEECAALAQVFDDTRAVFGWDTENGGQVDAPTEETIPLAEVPTFALPHVLRSAAAAMLQANAPRAGRPSTRALRQAGRRFDGSGKAVLILEA